MPHVLKKYISNRGSALFMVLSTMTALLISSMAMYFSMVSSRASQYAVFNHTQANQSAQSIATIINKALTSAGNLSAPDVKGKALLDKMMSLNVGESITTTADNFASLDPTNSSATNPDVPDLGAYAVIITLTKNDPATGEKIFDIAVLSSVDGNREIVHLEYGYSSSIENQGSPGESELFVATGYVPNDAYIDGGFFLTNTFFDTEFTYVGQYDSKANFLSGNLSTGGSLIFSSYMQPIVNEDRMGFLAKPTTWSIRGDFEQNGSNQVQLMAGSKIMIGGDAYFNAATVNSIVGKGSVGGKIDLYILGDFNMKANMSFENVNVYVNGDFNYPAGLYIDFNNLYVNGNVNFADTAVWGARPRIKGTSVATPDAMPKWEWAGPDDARGMSVAEVSEELGRRTSTNTYGKWEIQDTLVQDEDGKRIKVQLNSSNTFQNGVEGMKTVYTIALAGSESAKPEGVNGWTADCVLGTYTNAATAVVGGATIDGFQGKVNGGNPLAIILDTGDNPDNIMALRLKPYIDMDNNGTTETFGWIGKDGISNNNPFTILVKGRGSVILDVAEDATYQESNFQQFMHYSWFRILGGKEETKTGSKMDSTGGWNAFSSYVYDSSPINGGTPIDGKKPDALAASLIHDNCKGGDGCSYTTATSTNKCGVCNKEFVDITCSEHGKVNSFCPDCQEYIQDKLTKFSSGGEGFCGCRIDKDKADAFLNSHNDIKTAISDATGVIYPNVNIYLVSISEGSDLRFATDINGTAIMQNSFYGYIYAPYVTYKAIGSSGSGCPRFIGGLLVSDYVINDNYAFLACYPDKMPDEMAAIGGGVMQGNLNSKTTKSWKTTIGGYR